MFNAAFWVQITNFALQIMRGRRDTLSLPFAGLALSRGDKMNFGLRNKSNLQITKEKLN